MPPPPDVGPSRPGVPAASRSDGALARRATMGDTATFAEVVARHGESLHRYAVRMLDGDYHSAEDAVQEALTKGAVETSGRSAGRRR